MVRPSQDHRSSNSPYWKNNVSPQTARCLRIFLITLFLIGTFGSTAAADGDIVGNHTVGRYQISPFYDNLSEREPGLEVGKKLIRIDGWNNITVTYLKHRIISTFFRFFEDTPFRETARSLTPLIFALLGFVAILRFASKEKKQSPVPQKIREFLTDHPGATQKEIIAAVGVSRGSVVYHLSRLTFSHKIHKDTSFGHAYYYPKKPDMKDPAVLIRTLLAQQKYRKIAEILLENPGSTREEIAAALEKSPESVYRHLKKMQSENIITGIRDKHTIRYTLRPQTVQIYTAEQLQNPGTTHRER